jgi:hypothetical protein
MSILNALSARRCFGLICAAFLATAICSSQASAGTIYAIDDQNNLFTFDNTAPQNITGGAFLTGLKQNEHLIGIDFRPATGVPGTLYGIGSSYQVYTVNAGTGVCTPVGAGFGPIAGNSFGMDFNPAADRIRLISDVDTSIRIDPVSGLLAATDSPVAYKSGDTNFGKNPNVVGAGYTNSVNPAPATTTLYGIDSNTNSLVRIGGVDGGAPEGSPNLGMLTTIASLGVDANNLVGFDISSNNVGFAALSTGGNSSLYGINLATGTTILAGQIIGGVHVVDIALEQGVVFNLPLPEPTSVVMAGLGIATLLAFRKRRSQSQA